MWKYSPSSDTAEAIYVFFECVVKYILYLPSEVLTSVGSTGYFSGIFKILELLLAENFKTFGSDQI